MSSFQNLSYSVLRSGISISQMKSDKPTNKRSIYFICSYENTETSHIKWLDQFCNNSDLCSSEGCDRKYDINGPVTVNDCSLETSVFICKIVV